MAEQDKTGLFWTQQLHYETAGRIQPKASGLGLCIGINHVQMLFKDTYNNLGEGKPVHTYIKENIDAFSTMKE